MTDEEIQLNRISAEIMPKGLLQEYTVRPWHGWRFKVTDGIGDLFSPATDLNHNAMVMDTFNDWMVSKQKSEFRKGRIYTCTIWTDIGKWFIGQADTEVLARARAYEKAWEGEKHTTSVNSNFAKGCDIGLTNAIRIVKEEMEVEKGEYQKVSTIAIHNCNDNMTGESPNYFCNVCGQRL